MSKEIDERVVSMQFDNAHFEKNVQTSMSTLDKLKSKLNFKGAASSLETVSSAAKKVNFSPLHSGVEAVQMKFSALQVIATTALANITNSAVNAGKRIVAAFTIDPVKTGFSEYELKMGSIQTIMASTGESLETVNKYLNELNAYSDKTIYSFSDMTQNIGKFTNAGVKLEDAVLAIKGISNEAAVSGANANEASRAMYNFAQALSSGYVKLIDWKSIENANMATVEFKTQLLESAVAAGTLTKSADGMYKTLKGNTLNATQNFNDTLQDQWMTSEVLIETLKDYADETTDIGKKAYASAQDVKTFSQMMDTLKESAQSGWAQTWEIIFGDFEEAKAMWTSLSKVLGGFIETISDARNAFFSGVMDTLNGRTLLIKAFKNIGNSLVKVFSAIGKAWHDIFPPENRVKIAYNLIAAFHKMSTYLVVNEEEAKKFARVFKGLFAVLDIVLTLISGPLKIAFKIIKSVLGAFNISVLDAAANVGDAIVMFRDWIDSVLDFDWAIQAVLPYITKITRAIKKWIKGFKQTDNIPKYIIKGIVNGIKKGFDKIRNAMSDLGTLILDTVKEILGIHSPSKEFIQIAEDCISGFIKGIQNGATKVVDVLKKFGQLVLDTVNEIGLDKIIEYGIGIAAVVSTLKLANALSGLSAPFVGLGQMLEGIGDAFEGLGASLRANAWKKKAESVLMIAAAIALLAGAVYLLSDIDQGRLWATIGAIAALGGILAVLTITIQKFTDVTDTMSTVEASTKGIKGFFSGLQSFTSASIILSISAGILLIAIAIEKLAGLNKEELEKAPDVLKILAKVIGMIGGLVLAFGVAAKLASGEFAAAGIKAVTKAIRKIVWTMLLMLVVIKLAAKIKPEEIEAAKGVLLSISALFGAFVLISKLPGGGSADKIGKMISKISIAMLLMLGVVKLAAKLTAEEVEKATGFIVRIGIFFGALVVVAAMAGEAGENVSKLGSMLLKISIAMLIMVAVFKLAGTLDKGDVKKGTGVILAAGVFFGALMIVAAKAKEGADAANKLANMILKVSIAIGLLAGLVYLIGQVDDPWVLVKGGAVVGGLLGLVIRLTAATAKIKTTSLNPVILMLGSLAIIMGSLIALSCLNPEKVKQATLSIAAVIGALTLMIIALGKMKPPEVTKIGALVVLLIGLGVVMGSLIAISVIDPNNLLKTATGIGVLLLAMAGSLLVLNKVKLNPSALIAMGLMALIMWETGKLMTALNSLNPEGLVTKATAVGLLLAAMAGICLILNFVKFNSGGLLAVASMALIMWETAALMGVLRDLEVRYLDDKVKAVAAMLLAMAGVVLILNKFAPGAHTAANVLMLAVLVASIGLVFDSLSKLGVGEVVTCLIALGGALAILAVGLNFLTGTLAGSAALLVAAMALGVLAPVLVTLGSMSLGQIAIAIIALAGALTVLGVAGALLAPVAVPLLAIGGAIALIGVGALAAGAGVMLFAQGIALLGSNMPMAISFITQLALLMPFLAQQTALAVAAFVVGLVQGLAMVVSAIVVAIADILSVLAENTPKIISSIVQIGIGIVVGLIDGIAAMVPELINSAFNLIVSFIDGLAQAIDDNGERINDAVKKLCKAMLDTFLDFFGINSPSKVMKENGGYLVDGLVNGVENEFKGGVNAVKELGTKCLNKIKEYKDKFKTAGINACKGFASGLMSKVGNAVDAAKNVGKKAWKALKDTLGIHSPSKEFAKLGKYSDEGFAVGIKSYAGKVIDATKNLGSDTLKSMQNAMARVSDAVNTDVNSQPTIRPVLDLSDIESGAGSISRMLDINPSVGLRANVNSVSSMMSKRQNGATNNDVVSALNDLKSVMGNSSGDTYQINGITYDDGSNITNAVKTLVRAARVERRV